MAKKLSVLGIAFAAVAAIVMPATASASPQLFEGSTALAKGATIVGTSTNAVLTNTALGTVKCAKVQNNGVLDTNSGSEIKGHGAASSTTTCNAEGLPATVTEWFWFFWVTNGGDSGTMTWFIFIHVGPFECKFEGTGAFTYTTNTDVLHIPGTAMSGPEICEPEEGSAVMEGDFTITTSNGTAVTIK